MEGFKPLFEFLVNHHLLCMEFILSFIPELLAALKEVTSMVLEPKESNEVFLLAEDAKASTLGVFDIGSMFDAGN